MHQWLLTGTLLAGSAGPEYEFLPDTEPMVGVWHGGPYSIGRLDAAGNFTPDKRYVRITGDLRSGPRFLFINRSLGAAYEYRSGMLVKGTLEESGNFVPEKGRKVIPFSEYRYRPGAVPIYNLPGRFVKKGGSE